MVSPLLLELPSLNAIAAERERLFQELTDCAETAFLRRGMVERGFRFHDRSFTMRFAGEQMARTMSRALNHLATERSGESEFVIDCWAAAESGTSFPMPQWPTEYFAGRGEILGLDSPKLRIGYFDWIKLLNAYFPDRNRAFYCVAQEDGFPLQQLGSPALNIFNWWLGTLGCQLVHAAAVATPSGGVLIAGHGGAGKSTLAFSTLGTPLRYLSDDYCVLTPEPVHVRALYGAGKLTEASVKLLQHLRPHAVGGEECGAEKSLFFLNEQFPDEQILQAPLRAVVLSHLDPAKTCLEPIPWREVLGIMADSTMRQLAGSNHRDFLRMLRLIQNLPTYRLHHGGDWNATHRLLLQLCAS